MLFEKKNLAEMTTTFHPLSFVVTRCDLLYLSLSLVVPLVLTRCCSLSLDAPLVCLFIHDRFLGEYTEELSSEIKVNKYLELDY